MSILKYHRLCQENRNLFSFYDEHYLCVCEDDHIRAECFGYDHSLDRCSRCAAGGRCLQGHQSQLNDFICLCPLCRSGRTCLFNTEIFAFTLDQLFITDLISSSLSFYFLIIGPLIIFFLGLLNNICSYVTFRRLKCLRNGIGVYLLCMSISNQINLGILAARLIHLSFNITDHHLHMTFNKIVCKLLSYLLSCSSHIPYYLSSLVAIERLYITLFYNGQWLKNPHIARRLIGLIIIVVGSSSAYELLFVNLQTDINNKSGAMCVVEFPLSTRSVWLLIHQTVTIIHSILPLFINICCTCMICCVLIKSKMRTSATNTG